MNLLYENEICFHTWFICLFSVFVDFRAVHTHTEACTLIFYARTRLRVRFFSYLLKQPTTLHVTLLKIKKHYE